MKKKGNVWIKTLVFGMLAGLAGCSAPSVDDKVVQGLQKLDGQAEYAMDVDWELNTKTDWKNDNDAQKTLVWKSGDAIYEYDRFFIDGGLEKAEIMKTVDHDTTILTLVPEGKEDMVVESVMKASNLDEPFLRPLLELLLFPLDLDAQGNITIPSMFRRDDFNTEFRLVLTELTPFANTYASEFCQRHLDPGDPEPTWGPYHMIYDFTTEKSRFTQIDIDEESAGWLGTREFHINQKGTVTFPVFTMTSSQKRTVEALFARPVQKGDRVELKVLG